MLGLTPRALWAAPAPRAADGRSRDGETAATQALFRAVWEQEAPEHWAAEQSAALRAGGVGPTRATVGVSSPTAAAASPSPSAVQAESEVQADPGLWLWGAGALGTGLVVRTPKQPDGLPELRAIAGGKFSSLGLANDGTVWELNHQTGTAVESVAAAIAIASGRLHWLALASDRTDWAWALTSGASSGTGPPVTIIRTFQRPCRACRRRP